MRPKHVKLDVIATCPSPTAHDSCWRRLESICLRFDRDAFSTLNRQAHNLKVVGSNPTPATKLRRQVKDLAALPFWRLWLVLALGSTVEAGGSAIRRKSTRWRVRN